MDEMIQATFIHLLNTLPYGSRGELKQYCEKSMSRSCLNNNKGIVERLMNRWHIPRRCVVHIENPVNSSHSQNHGSFLPDLKENWKTGVPYMRFGAAVLAPRPAAYKTITFMKEGIGQLHFGNTEGSNMLEGK